MKYMYLIEKVVIAALSLQSYKFFFIKVLLLNTILFNNV